MLTLEQLIKLTAPDVGKNLVKYRLTGFSKRHKTDDQNRSFNLVTAAVTGGSRVRACSIRLYGSDVTASALVRCTCEYFTMHLEVALVARGSAVLSQSTGEYPKKKNPQLKPGLCPHLVLVSLVLASGETPRAFQAKMAKQDTGKAVQISATLKNMMKS